MDHVLDRHDVTLSTPSAARATRLIHAGTGVLRYGLVFLLTLIGSFKFFAFEAEGVEPLIAHSPVLSWMLPLLGTRGASDVIGVFEVTSGLLIASRRLRPLWSAYGSLAASFTFLVTLSFLFTTPGALDQSNPLGGFLMKDVILLGAALYTAGEALAAARSRS
jgi:uncharacterized membrane protein YkgB